MNNLTDQDQIDLGKEAYLECAGRGYDRCQRRLRRKSQTDAWKIGWQIAANKYSREKSRI